MLTEHLGVFHVVGDEDERHAQALLQGQQLLAHGGAQVGVEGGEGFVQQQGPRFGDQGTGQGGALALAAGQIGWILAGQRGQPEGIKPACH